LDIFGIAVELQGAARRAALDAECADDGALRAEVESLLEAHDAAGTFLSDPTPCIDAHTPAEIGGEVSGSRPARSGRMIGRYKLLERIGEGGFGVVWMAEQQEPIRRRVALKLIKLGMDTNQLIARFEAERQALAMMDHPCIARVLDAGASESGRPYFVMEYIKGVPILEFCGVERMDTRSRLHIFVQVCNAIHHAHQKGIIHRDIKPSNVLITLHDGVPVPKVIDFGIAKATGVELTARTLFTEHRQLIGSPAYMSPEQAEMSGLDIDTRSDVYSLGVLLYQLLTDTTPFSNEELMSAGFEGMLRIMRDREPQKPSTRLGTLGDAGAHTASLRRADVRGLTTTIRGDLDWIVMRCLEKDRTRRYQSASDLAADVERHLADEPVVAGPPSAGYRIGKFARRHRAGVIAATALLGVLVLGIAGTTGGMLWAISQSQRAAAAQRNAELELSRANEVRRLISEMIAGVKPDVALGADTTLLKGVLDDTAARIERGEISDELIEADLRHVIGVAYGALGMWDSAMEHVDVSLDIRRRLLGPDHRDTLQSMEDLIAQRGASGNATGIEPLAAENLERRRRVLGPEHPDTLRSMEQLANVYGSLGRVDDAERLVREALGTRRRLFGPDDLATLASLSQLAVIQASHGQYEEAADLLADVLDARRRALSEDHPLTLLTMHQLGQLDQFLGRYDEAEAVMRDLLSRTQRVLGERHRHTIQTRSELGSLYVLMGRDEDACRVFEADVEACRQTHGPQHPRTWDAMRDLGAAYERTGRRTDAIELYRELLESVPVAGVESSTPRGLLTIAWVLTRDIDELRDPERAVDLAERAMEQSPRPMLAFYILDTLALAQHQSGDSEAAIATARQAIALIPPQLPERVRADYQTRLSSYESAPEGGP
jgi:tetratricopeptide (TPR) repeat protein